VAKDVYKICPMRNTPEAIRRFFGEKCEPLTNTVWRRLAATLGFGRPRRKPGQTR